MTNKTLWPRSTLLGILTIVILFFGGAAAGSALAGLLAPGSFIGQIAGFAMLPLSFGMGMTMWYWIALTVLSAKAVHAVLSKRPDESLQEAIRSRAGTPPTKAPPGAFVFIPVSTAICLLAGVIVAVGSVTRGGILAVASFTLAGLIYGSIARWLAVEGYLPLPEEV